MRKRIIRILLISCLFLLSACSLNSCTGSSSGDVITVSPPQTETPGATEAPASPTATPAPVSPGTSTVTPTPGSGPSSSAEPPAAAEIAYVSAETRFVDPYKPTIVFNSDGTFEMTENVLSGMGHYKGDFSYEDGLISLYIKESDLNDGLSLITLAEIDENTFLLQTNVRGSERDDVFICEGGKVPSAVWRSHGDRFEDLTTPALITYDDGTFVLVESLSLKMAQYNVVGKYWGTYSESGRDMKFTVEGYDLRGAVGEDIKEFHFMKQVGGSIVLLRDLYLSEEGDHFLTRNTPYLTRVYRSNSDYFSTVDKQFKPSLTIHTDGTFTLTENFLAAMGEYTGTYIEDDSGLTLYVKNCSVSGFAGDDVKKIVFYYIHMGSIELETDLCGSRAGDPFYTESDGF